MSQRIVRPTSVLAAAILAATLSFAGPVLATSEGAGASAAAAQLSAAPVADANVSLARRLTERRPIIPLPPTLLSGIVGLAFIAAKTIGNRRPSRAKIF